MRNPVNQTVECTLFRTAFDTTSYTAVTLGGYLADVVNGKYKQQVENVRALVTSGHQEEAGICKKNLPLLVAGGRMAGGRKREHLVDYSGCVVGDLDHVSGSPSELLGRAKELPYVKAGHISPSGTGLKLFVLVDSDMEHHAQAFAVVSRLLETDLPGVKVDPSGKDPNRGCFVSYDPSAFYKEASEVVNVPIGPDKADVFSEAEPRSLANYIDKFETGNPFSDGGRHSYVVKLASALNSAGFGESEVVAECLYRYTAPGFGEKEILTTVSDIYRRYRSAHGSNSCRQLPGMATKKSIKNLKSITPVSEDALSDEGFSMEPDYEPVENDFPHFEKPLLATLPSLLADALKPAADDTEHDLILLAALTMISTALPNVRGSMQNEIYYPPFYTVVTGPSGSGKGCVSRVFKMIEPWQRSVYDDSFRKVEEYNVQKEAYEGYKQQQRQSRTKKPAGIPPECPRPVYQKQLHMGGYTTTARMIAQLEINAPYASFLFETELESVNNTMAQDFGGYGYILNQAFHGERVSCASKTNGTNIVERPKLGMFLTGTPGMFTKLVPSTENGLFSRLLIYHIVGGGTYRCLTSADDDPKNASYFSELGERLRLMAVFLEQSETFVSFTDRQRKKLDRYFSREYYNVRVFGNDDVTSVVLRHRLIIFRIAMVLTALRKAEEEVKLKHCSITDADFEVAFHIGTVCLRHSMLVSTTLKHSDTEQHFKMHTAQRDLFAAMPDKFKTATLVEEAVVRGISRSSAFRMLKKAQMYDLLISLGAGYYDKTDSGKNVTISKKG